MRFYRGTMTVTNVTVTSTFITTTSGELVHAVPSATEPSRWIISIDALDLNGQLAGDSLTILSQAFTLEETGGFAGMTNAMASRCLACALYICHASPRTPDSGFMAVMVQRKTSPLGDRKGPAL